MNLGDLHKVWEIKALKRKPGNDEAQKILERIAKQVQPIMRKYKWRVKVLSEFCPNNPRLLGLNVGAGVHVKLRLRRPNKDWDFYPYDQILDTMLHELCHNAHGPHNANFYKLWDELRKECEELIAKGVAGTGEGFDLPGRRLGGFTCQPPLSSLHEAALTAAEKRARIQSLMPSGPKRLGGDSTIMIALSPVQAAAMAAERRLHDDIWCASHSYNGSIDDENDSAILEDIVDNEQCAGSLMSTNDCKRKHPETEFIDLSVGDRETKSQRRNHISERNVVSQPAKSHSASTSSELPGVSTSNPILDNETISSPCELDMWECATCTLFNPPLAPICKLCSTQKPKDASNKYEVWSCKFCTLENSVKLERCSACGEWRYSYGAPVSTPAPTFST